MLDQEKFFNTYKVQEAFEDSGLSWDTLEKIYEDYTRRLPEMKKIADRLQDEISKVIDFHVHSIHNRCKDPELSLIHISLFLKTLFDFNLLFNKLLYAVGSTSRYVSSVKN